MEENEDLYAKKSNAQIIEEQRERERIRKSMLLERGRIKMLRNKRELLDSRQIVGNTLNDFLRDYDQAMEEGFERNEDGNNFPLQIGALYTCTVLKYGDFPEPKKPDPEREAFEEKFGSQAGAAVVEAEAVVAKSRGRKPANKS